MWVARVLKRPVDKSDAPSLSRARFKKLDSGGNRSFVTLAHHLRLVATNIEVQKPRFRGQQSSEPNFSTLRDQVYIGRCPDLITGIHGSDPVTVFEELCQTIDEAIEHFS